MFGRYKPDPRVYAEAARLLGLAPGEVGMVAAHEHDLLGAQAAGLRTIFVPRPDEYGPEKAFKLPEAIDTFDVVADDFVELANRLKRLTSTEQQQNSIASSWQMQVCVTHLRNQPHPDDSTLIYLFISSGTTGRIHQPYECRTRRSAGMFWRATRHRHVPDSWTQIRTAATRRGTST